MKRALVSVCALFWALALTALPARRGGVQYIQPDGSRLEIFLHGDEWGHWVTDREGRLLDVDADGFYRCAWMLYEAQTIFGIVQSDDYVFRFNPTRKEIRMDWKDEHKAA